MDNECVYCDKLSNGVLTGNLDKVKTLLTSNATCFGDALFNASDNNYTDILVYLVQQGANVNKEQHYSRLLLHLEIIKGDRGMVGWLIDQGANINQQTTEHGYNALLCAYLEYEKTQHSKYLDIMHDLLIRGANVDKIVRGRETILIRAATRGFIPLVKLMIEYNCNINLRNARGETAYHKTSNQYYKASDKKYKSIYKVIMDYLLLHGAKKCDCYSS